MKAEINGVKMEGTPDEIATVVKLVGAATTTATVTWPNPHRGFTPRPLQPWAPNVTWGGVSTRGPIAGTYVGDVSNGPSGRYSAITFTTVAGGV